MINFVLEQEQEQKLLDFSSKENKSLNQIINEAIEFYFNFNQNKLKGLDLAIQSGTDGKTFNNLNDLIKDLESEDEL